MNPLPPLPRHTPVAPTIIAAMSASLLGLVLALTIALAILSLAHAQYFAVASDSMVPAFRRGDLVVSRSVTNLHIGDTVTFRKYGRLVTHRIVAVGRQVGSFETRGDANVGRDPWTITAADVVGRVENVVSRAGYPLLLLESASGRVLLGNGIAAIVICLWWATPRATRVSPRLLHPSSGYAIP